MRRMLDICSGLGGASQAFQEHPDWEVHRIENNLLLKDVPGTTLIDVFEWDYKREIPRGYYDLIWASPPCTEFSQAYAAPGPTARRENRAFSPDLGIAKKCLEIIEYFDPGYWVLENVQGSSKILSQLIGKPPRQIVGPFYLWGVFPFLSMSSNYKHRKYEDDTWSSDPLRANKRGMVPFEVSNELLNSIMSPTLGEWY